MIWNLTGVFNNISKTEVTCGQVWWPIFGICAPAFNPAKYTHTPWTHTRSSGQPYCCGAQESSWGFSALLKSLPSIVVLRMEESAGYSLPPPTIPARPETRTYNLRVTCPSLTIRPRLPQKLWKLPSPTVFLRQFPKTPIVLGLCLIFWIMFLIQQAISILQEELCGDFLWKK